MEIVELIKKQLVDNINDSIAKFSTVELPLNDLASKNVIIADVDPDKYKFDTMVHVVQGRETYESLTYSNRVKEATLQITITIIERGEPNPEKLYLKTVKYSAAVIDCLLMNSTLGGNAEFIDILESDYSPAVEGSAGLNAIDLTIEVTYQKTM